MLPLPTPANLEVVPRIRRRLKTLLREYAAVASLFVALLALLAIRFASTCILLKFPLPVYLFPRINLCFVPSSAYSYFVVFSVLDLLVFDSV